MTAAKPLDLARKIEKAKKLRGSRLIISQAPCPTGWGFEPQQSVAIGKLAVQTGVWPLKEYCQGQTVHMVVPRRRLPVEEHLKTRGRFTHLFAEVDAYWAAV